MKLSSAEDAIKQAVEAGFIPKSTGLLFDMHVDRMREIEKMWKDAVPSMTPTNLENSALHAGYGEGFRDCSIILDPAFWQALGKARGWKEIICKICRDHICGHGAFNRINGWRHYAHQWLDVELSRGNINDFWESLP